MNKQSESVLPRPLVWLVIALSVLPFSLHYIAGLDLGTPVPGLDWSRPERIDPVEFVNYYYAFISVAFNHTILEWTAFCAALFTMFLAFMHYSVKRDIRILVIGTALFCAGCLDAFEILAADRLVNSFGNNRDFLPFTWALKRFFHGLITITAVSLFLVKRTAGAKTGPRFVLLLSALFALVAYFIMQSPMIMRNLPRAQYDTAPLLGFITRPYDLAPLFLFLLAGLVFFPMFHRRHPGIFSHALLISTIPAAAVQVHMAFGSRALFDHHFNSALFLKITAYALPLLGLGLEYIRSFRREHEMVAKLTGEIEARKAIRLELDKIENRNREILNAIPDMIFTINDEFRYVDFRASGELDPRVPPEEFMGRRVDEILPDPPAGPIMNAVQRVLGNGVSTVVEFDLPANPEVHVHAVNYFEARVIKSTDTEVLVIVRDIGARKREEETVEIYTEELEKANAELRQFAYIASHDLQEPLRSVVSFLQLLERKKRDALDEDARRYIDRAINGSKHMQNLISALLEYSRIGTHGKEFEPTDSSSIISNVLDGLEAALTESKARVSVGEMPTIHADGTQLGQVFQNLIGNAVKFRVGEPEIHIDARPGDGETIFSVRDNGIGIEDRFAERIFVVFQRLHTRTEYPGTGIGLAICKKIIERHGGRIWMESRVGEGTTFFFTIPDRENSERR